MRRRLVVPPPIALVMPFLNEERNLPAVLASLQAQSIEHTRLRLIAVDDGSTDGGPALVRDFLAASDIAGEIVRASVRSIPHALNRGFERVREDEIAVRLDAHTTYAPGYLAAIDAALARLPESIWCVGAAPTPGPQATFGLALHGALFTNPMGLGPAPFRTGAGEIEVDHVYLGAWRPGVVRRVGGFDETWLANEDAEFSARLRAAGGRIARIDLASDLALTRGPLGAVSQWHRYGMWRARTIRRHPAVLRSRHLAPPLALAAAVGVFSSPARRLLVPLGLAYAGAVIAKRDRAEPPSVTAATLLFFPAVHVAYALGLVRGALRPVRSAPPPGRPDQGKST